VKKDCDFVTVFLDIYFSSLCFSFIKRCIKRTRAMSLNAHLTNYFLPRVKKIKYIWWWYLPFKMKKLSSKKICLCHAWQKLWILKSKRTCVTYRVTDKIVNIKIKKFFFVLKLFTTNVIVIYKNKDSLFVSINLFSKINQINKIINSIKIKLK
jgi:hypothetical protein